jgi:hypothetical protein
VKDAVLQVPEYHAVVLREQPLAHSVCVLDTPERAFEFIQGNVNSSPRFTPNVENFCVLFLNTRPLHRLAHNQHGHA